YPRPGPTSRACRPAASPREAIAVRSQRPDPRRRAFDEEPVDRGRRRRLSVLASPGYGGYPRFPSGPPSPRTQRLPPLPFGPPAPTPKGTAMRITPWLSVLLLGWLAPGASAQGLSPEQSARK